MEIMGVWMRVHEEDVLREIEREKERVHLQIQSLLCYYSADRAR